MPHMMVSFATLVGGSRALDPNTENILNELVRVGVFLTKIKRLVEGYVIKSYALNERRRIVREEHHKTISAMSNLATTLGEQGHLEEAAKMLKEVLEKRKRILGDEHLSTISAINNLANTLREQGHLKEATKIKKEVLEKIK